MGVRISVSKEQMESRKPVPTDIYDVILKGFKPKLAKSGQSTNLQPILAVTNHKTLNGNRIFDNLNTNAGFYHEDFVHCFGLPMEQVGPEEFAIPGEFMPDPSDPQNPAKWTYNGPLIGRVGKVEVVMGKDDKGKDRSQIKRFLCAVTGCQKKHSENLIKA